MISADLPGIEKSDIEVKVEENTLILIANRHIDKSDNNENSITTSAGLVPLAGHLNCQKLLRKKNNC